MSTRHKHNLLRNLTSEQADAMVEMMHEKLGPELSAAIEHTPFSQNHYFRFMYICDLCTKTREKKELSFKDISKDLKIPQYKLKYVEESGLNNIEPEILDKYIDYLGLRSEFSEWLKNNRDVYEELGTRK